MKEESILHEIDYNGAAKLKRETESSSKEEEKLMKDMVNPMGISNKASREFWNDSWPVISEKLVLLILASAIWGIIYFLFGRDYAGFDSPIFRLSLMFITAKFCGWLIGLCKVPQLLGMLLVGVIFRSTNFIEISGNYVIFLAILRKIALINTLLPAGLGLNAKSLRSMFVSVCNLSIVPSIIEVVAMMCFSKWILNVPWAWGCLNGMVITAVSPSVVIPCLFQLQDQGFGVDKGIHTLLIAATTISDVISIAAFGINVGLIYSTKSTVMQVLDGPIAIFIGIGFGVLMGITAQHIPDKNNAHVVTLRTLFIGIGSVFACLGADYIGYGVAGTLGCIISAFVAATSWKKVWGEIYNPVKQNFSLLWKFMEPISFALIGFEINLGVLKGALVLWCILAFLLALTARFIATVAIFYKSQLNFKETIFVAFAWIPKATVQATIGPIALDLARESSNLLYMEYANTTLVLAVLAIVLTAPIGTVLILTLGPRFLHNSNTSKNNQEFENTAL